MRLVLILATFPKLSETFIVSKFSGLLEKGWDVYVVTQKHDRQAWSIFAVLQQHPEWQKRIWQTPLSQPRWLLLILFPLVTLWCWLWHPLGSWRYFHQGWRQQGWRTFYSFYLDSPLIALQPDIIHFEFGALAPERIHLKDCLGSRLTVSFRGYDLNHVCIDAPNYYQYLWGKVDAIHTLGYALWRKAQWCGCPDTMPHKLIPPAIDTDFFVLNQEKAVEVVGTSSRPFRILSVGRLEWKKGYEYALQAIRILQEQGVICEYRIVGEGKYLAALMYARHQLGVTQAVELLEARPRDEIKAQMAWADVFLHSSVSEGFGNAVIEAQAMQLPVVTSDAGGLAENVIDNWTGYVVPRRDPVALAARLLHLMNNPKLRLQLGMQGREHVLAHFQLSDQINAFANFYEHALHD